MNKIEKFAEAVKEHEGWFPGSRSQRNQNPGNFRCSKLMTDLGATRCDDNFSVFPNYETGWKALIQFITYACNNELRAYKDKTIYGFFEVYAPSGDDNTPRRYAEIVANNIGLSPNTRMKDLIEKPMNTTLLSQRDPLWAGEYLGKSNSTVGRYGCTITSISMGTGYFNKWNSPKQLAKELEYTTDGLLIWGSLPKVTIFKLEKRFYGQKDELIQEALKNPRKICLIQVENYHWVLATGKSLLGGYKMNDPWFGDKSTTKRYKSITGGAVLVLK